MEPGHPETAGAASGEVASGVPAAARALAWNEVEAAVSAIRARYGNASVGPATLIGRGGLVVKERGDTQWGPSVPPAPPPTVERPKNPGEVPKGSP